MDNSLLLNEIDAEKKILDSKRPFSHPTFENIRKNILVEWTHHSNAVEGNTLTLSETEVVLEGITVGGKTMKEHLDVINYREAIHYIEEIIKKKEALSTSQIKKIHSIVLKGMIHENTGVYRKEDAVIRGIDRVPPDYLQVPRQMSDLIHWYVKEDQKLHSVERVAILYSQFIKIYPFADGNGRTARLLLNLELMKKGYVPIVIRKENRSEYYNGIDLSHRTGEHSLFIGFVAQILRNTLHFYNQKIT